MTEQTCPAFDIALFAGAWSAEHGWEWHPKGMHVPALTAAWERFIGVTELLAERGAERHIEADEYALMSRFYCWLYT